MPILIAIITIMLFSCNAHGAIITADSCSSTDVQAAINAASAGDTVMIPAGACEWASSTATAPIVAINKSLTLQGAGYDNTKIYDKSLAGVYGGYLASILDVNLTTEGQFVTIRDIFFGQNGSDVSVNRNNEGMLSIRGTYSATPKFRITNCKFDNWNGRAMQIFTLFGVIDNCIIGHAYTITGQFFRQYGTTDDWSRNDDFGTARAVYVESCDFNAGVDNWSVLADVMGGSRIVIRYNSFINTGFGSHGYHDETTSARGPRLFEYYNNTFDINRSDYRSMMTIRGGVGVFYNNTITQTKGSVSSGDTRGIKFTYYGLCPSTSYVQIGTGCSGGLDNKGPRCSSYPCPDQPGWGKYIDGVQESSPWYIWNNTLDGSPLPSSFPNASPSGCSDCDGDASPPTVAGTCATDGDECNSAFIKVNREWFEAEKQDYTPYTYPHPLRGEGTVDPTPNVRMGANFGSGTGGGGGIVR